MPYQFSSEYVDADIFLEHAGRVIYHAYRDDDYEEPLQSWYSVKSDDPGYEFDVRELPVPAGVETGDHRAIIKAAIDTGILDDLFRKAEESDALMESLYGGHDRH